MNSANESPSDPPRIGRGRTFSRSGHRSANHASAHAAGSPPSSIPDHPLIPKGNATLIESQSGLDDLLSELRRVGSFSYDSEFIGELTYHPRLCLIQVSTSSAVYLVDPLAKLDLAGFYELICDASVEKIVHAGAQDIEPVIRISGNEPKNVFDTQICAGFIGMAYPVSLSKLVNEFTGAKLGKGLTFSHWDHRPLSSAQLRYAADDVRYLPALRAMIGQRLEALGHARWAQEECDTICRSSNYAFDANAVYMKLRGASALSSTGLAILRELVGWRDRSARQDDLPPRSFLRDEILVDMARSPIRDVAQLSKVKGLPRPVEEHHGAEVVAATATALALPASEMPTPRIYEPSPTERFRSDAMHAAVQAICCGRSIDPAVVTSRQELSEFFRAYHADESCDAMSLMIGWRREALGGPLTEMLEGKRDFAMHWKDGALQTAATNNARKD